MSLHILERGLKIVFFQQLVNGLTLGSAYAVIAIGYTLVFGVLNIVNMAHGGIFMIGAYIGLLLVTEAGLGIFPALIGAMIGGAVLGYGLEIFALRPLRRRKVTHLAPLISTIGVSTFLESVALMVWGPRPVLSRLPSETASWTSAPLRFPASRSFPWVPPWFSWLS